MFHFLNRLNVLSTAGCAKYALLMLAGVACIASLAQSTGPTETKNTTSKALASMDLAGEIPDGAGRQLRARAVTIEPGGHTAAHTHVNRPTLEYVQQGNVIEIRNGVEIPHSAGEMVPAGNGTSHHWVNRGHVPVVLIPIDVFKP
jgi:quercetin dioxygenase-like cupin family protein